MKSLTIKLDYLAKSYGLGKSHFRLFAEDGVNKLEMTEFPSLDPQVEADLKAIKAIGEEMFG